MYQYLNALLSPFTALYLLIAVGLAVLWRKRVESRTRLLLATVPFVLLGIVSLPVVAYFAIGSLEWRYTLHTDLPKDTEAIVVLSGDLRLPDDRLPEAEIADGTLMRCQHAARLYRSRPCLIVVTGGKGDTRLPCPTLAQAMRDFLLEQGVKAEDLAMEDKARTTYENALFTKELLSQRAIKTIVLVTSASHMRRAEACFQAQGFEVTPSACDFHARGSAWSGRDFLPNASSSGDVQAAVHEWLGIAWYWLRGRI